MQASELEALRDAGIITEAKRAEIAAFLAARTAAPDAGGPGAATPVARFDLTHVLWYGGALIVIGAMGLFTNEAFNKIGGAALILCGVFYLLALLAAGDYLWFRRGLRTPGGLLVAAAISMVPMIIYGIQDYFGLWVYALGDPGQYRDFYPYVNGSWIYMEAGTVLAALLAIWRYRFPFILMIAGVALWFLSMDLAMWFTSAPGSYDEFEIRRAVSMWFGLATILFAWLWDVLKGRTPDMMFWIHLFGALAFWGGLSLHQGGTQLDKAIYCLINIGLIGFSLFLDRRIYSVIGALGVAIYLGYLASDVFKDMLAFSFALSAIGLVIIFAGLWLQRRRAAMTASLATYLPSGLQALRPADVR